MPSLLLRLLALLFALAVGASTASAQGGASDEQSRIEAARTAIDQIEKVGREKLKSFDGLLELRDQLDPVRDDLQALVDQLERQQAALKRELSAFGTGDNSRSPAFLQKQQAVTEVELRLREAHPLLVHSDHLWSDLTDRRRTLFTSRIFVYTDSLFYPGTWRHFFDVGIPRLVERARVTVSEAIDQLTAEAAWTEFFSLIALFAAASAAMVLVRWRFLAHLSHELARGEMPDSLEPIARRAVVKVLAYAVPYGVTGLLLGLLSRRFHILPDHIHYFLRGLAWSVGLYGLSSGLIRAAFSPLSAVHRIIRCDDETAERMVSLLRTTLLVYMGWLLILGWIAALSAPAIDTVMVTALETISTLGVGALVLWARDREPPGPETGLVRLPLHLVKPLFLLIAAVSIVALLLSYIALAGMLVGRAIASGVILCAGATLYVLIDAVFDEKLTPKTASNAAISRTLGIKRETVYVIGTVMAGTLRVLTAVFTVLLLLSPWGVEFGHVNVFADVFFGLRLADLKMWFGAVGIGLLLFGFGLVCTKMFVNWLDHRLLPRTDFDTGLRHSISTIAGYTGFALALTLALGQAGVQLQNIALVAGALSVGVGFGLQQVVSNFVAGLIVLAERPIRVGDTIVVKGEEGKVKRINVRSTEIELAEKSSVIVPNSEIVSSMVKNRSFTDRTQRLTFKVTVAHDADLKSAFTILAAAARAHPNVLAEPAPTVYFVRASEIGVEIDCNVHCDDLSRLSAIRSDLLYIALMRFRQAGVKLAQGAANGP